MDQVSAFWISALAAAITSFMTYFYLRRGPRMKSIFGRMWTGVAVGVLVLNTMHALSVEPIFNKEGDVIGVIETLVVTGVVFLVCISLAFLSERSVK